MKKTFVEIISDEKELHWFFDHVMPELKETEVYFLSLAARNKYLTLEERSYYELGRTEMFQKTVIRERSWERFIRTLRKLECDIRGYTTKNHKPIPSKSMVCYYNINPSDSFKALAMFQKVVGEYNQEAMSLLINGNDRQNFLNRLNKIDNNLMTAYQQATGTKYYLDIDFDLEYKSLGYVKSISEYLEEKKVFSYYWVDTKSGYHLLIAKEYIKFNPHEIIQFAAEIAPEGMVKEIELNSNNMIPLPGTFQGGHAVTILNKRV